jgi:DNA-directed RNA polymerase specialized sigma24 family protein
LGDYFPFLRSEDARRPAWVNYHERGIEPQTGNPDSLPAMSEDLWREYRETRDLSLRNRLELDPERQAAREEARAEFRRAFERLSAREREVAVLLYVKNLTLREIGRGARRVGEPGVADPLAAEAAHPRAAQARQRAVRRPRALARR